MPANSNGEGTDREKEWTVTELGQVISEYQVKGQFSVRLFQKKNRKFTVVYGGETHTDMGYHEAACEFGQCIMHAACAAGLIIHEV